MEERRRGDGEGEGAELSKKEIPIGGGGGGGVGGLPDWLFASDGRVWLLCLIFRVVNALLVQDLLQPRRALASLRGRPPRRFWVMYGHLTWEWKEGIRSYLHPMVFVLLYKVLSFLHLDVPWFMIKAPRLLQSVFASFGDLFTYKLSYVLFNKHVAQWTLFSQLTCWFMFFCITRTLSNSLETVLTSISLFYWLSLACIVRPTSAITWLYLGIWEFVKADDRYKFLFLEVFPIGILVLVLSCMLDWLMYGSLVFVPLNFLKFNLLSSGGDYYGTHKWHWYFTQGFPAMLLTFLPFSLIGIIHSKKWRPSGLVAWVLGVHSILGHKEFRLEFQVCPAGASLALMFSGYFLAAVPGCAPRDHNRKISSFFIRFPSRKYFMLFLIATNVPMALYMSLVHQRGSEDVMNFLAYEARDGKVKSILFLTPCHATPYYSTLHEKVPMQFLDCSPTLEKGALDESDQFMRNPTAFMSDMVGNWSLPSHIVLFDSEESQLRDFLFSHSFSEVKRFFHAHFKVDRDLQASIAVYALTEEERQDI
ncbi:unnamed protein product [Spirodela intermedia]|uniref:Mannosyltransferase n=1 Tax=Spirodela intermedia TaxID=51605 RepID=A0A7I8JJZ7_SPIIN|nr:unnamed protein product [Spirodela intermedia]CAA6670496.1 unnamed protein product [Spirodela intermedia]